MIILFSKSSKKNPLLLRTYPLENGQKMNKNRVTFISECNKIEFTCWLKHGLMCPSFSENITKTVDEFVEKQNNKPM